MLFTAAMAREMSNKAKPSDISVEIAKNKIVEMAKAGYYGANVCVPNEHLDESSEQARW